MLKIASMILVLSSYGWAQSVDELKSHFSGKIHWNESSSTLRFLNSGRVNFSGQEYKSSIWEVPSNVTRIEIATRTSVEIALKTFHSLDVSGDDLTSEIFGTSTAALLHDSGLDGDGNCANYSAVLGVGNKTVVNVKNLRSLNPIGFHFTGKNGAVFHLDHVEAIDDRGGFSNHSDGISAGSGTTVDNSYFSTGDDVIKVYNDITVNNTTIRMIRNSVPIELGWGSYGDSARGIFNNLKIIGDSGRNKDFPIINAQDGVYRKVLQMNGLTIDNSKATLFRFNKAQSVIGINIQNAKIAVGHYGEFISAGGKRIICGSERKATVYNCSISE